MACIRLFFLEGIWKKGNILNDFFCSFVNNPPVLAIRPGFVLQVFYIHSDMFQIMFLLCVGNVCMYVCMYVCMHACMYVYIYIAYIITCAIFYLYVIYVCIYIYIFIYYVYMYNIYLGKN